MIGVDLGIDDQLELLREVASAYGSEYRSFPDLLNDGSSGFYFDQQSFRSRDAEIPYCMIRRHQPRRLIGIGSGMSTLLAVAACEKSRLPSGASCEIVAIEPFPRDFVRSMDLSALELIRNRSSVSRASCSQPSTLMTYCSLTRATWYGPGATGSTFFSRSSRG